MYQFIKGNSFTFAFQPIIFTYKKHTQKLKKLKNKITSLSKTHYKEQFEKKNKQKEVNKISN
jgi:hypothetical protein